LYTYKYVYSLPEAETKTSRILIYQADRCPYACRLNERALIFHKSPNLLSDVAIRKQLEYALNRLAEIKQENVKEINRLLTKIETQFINQDNRVPGDTLYVYSLFFHDMDIPTLCEEKIPIEKITKKIITLQRHTKHGTKRIYISSLYNTDYANVCAYTEKSCLLQKGLMKKIYPIYKRTAGDFYIINSLVAQKVWEDAEIECTI